FYATCECFFQYSTVKLPCLRGLLFSCLSPSGLVFCDGGTIFPFAARSKNADIGGCPLQKHGKNEKKGLKLLVDMLKWKVAEKRYLGEKGRL
ncbi:MAG: hypothetical protein Q4D55_06145, partial [Eubacteriales bacterium]|nr:hypothetical protein [Eubacteriales bacterium]